MAKDKIMKGSVQVTINYIHLIYPYEFRVNHRKGFVTLLVPYKKRDIITISYLQPDGNIWSLEGSMKKYEEWKEKQ